MKFSPKLALAGGAMAVFFLMAFNTLRSSSRPAAPASGSISGRVIYAGGAVQKVKNVIKDEATCGMHDIMDQSLITSDDGGLRWTVVSLTDIKTDKAANAQNLPGEQVLDQSGCRFEPHVVLVGVNQPLTIINSDKTLHNVRTQAFLNDVFNKAQIYMPGAPKPTDTAYFSNPEVVEVLCDVHGWMKSYVHVVEHPYYVVTDEHGNFSLSDVPEGTYELKTWHETLGERTTKIKVEEGDHSVTLEYPKK